MANFCSKCGTSLPPGAASCPSCGTPAGAGAMMTDAPHASAPPPAAAYPQASAGGPPPVAGYPAPGPYPAKSSGGALKIILIVVAVVVGLGLVGAGVAGYAVWRVAHSVHVENNGGGVTLTAPGGATISTGDSTATEAEMGVPVYPGAEREKGGMSVSSASASMVMAHFTTSDSVSQVTDFYKGKMGDNPVVVSNGNGTVLSSGEKGEDSLTVTVGTGNGDDAGKTSILIVHSKKD
ncbi:MAG TPA: zinc ribbon domain-containing protein [Acidobacteriaceae bacterium]